jgi:hypothetical protein
MFHRTMFLNPAVALGLYGWATLARDHTGYAAAMQQVLVGGVDDRIDFLLG